MNNSYHQINAVNRKGGLRAAKQIYGIQAPRRFISVATLKEFREVFAAEYIELGLSDLLCVQLNSHNALYVLQDRLAILCAKWNMERLNVIDHSDWTVREFVLDEVV